MKSYKMLGIAGATMLLLSGCSGMYVDTDSVSMMPSKGNAFQQVLHKEYVKLAVMERDEDDGDDATYFVGKAKSAAMGEDVGPQPISERMIPKGAKDDITMARKNLVDKLWQGGADETPHAAARAQAMFDCWMQEQEENNQPADIKACRVGFEKAFTMINTPAPVVAKAMPKKMAPMMAPLPKPYVVYFASDSAELDDTAMMTLKLAFADYRLHKPGQVRIAGHTDTQGDAKYNEGLSRYRSNEVGNELMKLGISRKVISKSKFGETALAVQTGDNKAEKGNRRVSITFAR